MAAPPAQVGTQRPAWGADPGDTWGGRDWASLLPAQLLCSWTTLPPRDTKLFTPATATKRMALSPGLGRTEVFLSRP